MTHKVVAPDGITDISRLFVEYISFTSRPHIQERIYRARDVTYKLHGYESEIGAILTIFGRHCQLGELTRFTKHETSWDDKPLRDWLAQQLAMGVDVENKSTLDLPKFTPAMLQYSWDIVLPLGEKDEFNVFSHRAVTIDAYVWMTHREVIVDFVSNQSWFVLERNRPEIISFMYQLQMLTNLSSRVLFTAQPPAHKDDEASYIGKQAQ